MSGGLKGQEGKPIFGLFILSGVPPCYKLQSLTRDIFQVYEDIHFQKVDTIGCHPQMTSFLLNADKGQVSLLIL